MAYAMSVSGSLQCQCSRQPSMTIKSRAWSLDTSGDLLVWKPHRHRTADLSKAKLSAVRSHPMHCCAVALVSLLCEEHCWPLGEDSGYLAHSLLAANTNGVKEALSTSRTHSS